MLTASTSTSTSTQVSSTSTSTSTWKLYSSSTRVRVRVPSTTSLNSVDATEEVSCGPRLGRLCNHAKGGLQSAKPRIVVVDGEPHVCLFATKRLKAGLQILYDYGVNIPFQDKVC
jgi:hypothetical protein